MIAHDSQPRVVARDDTLDSSTTAPKRNAAAQRQWEYRLRRKHAVIEAIGNEATATRAALLTLLAHELAALEARSTPASMIEPARNTARRVLNEIITRYDIEL